MTLSLRGHIEAVDLDDEVTMGSYEAISYIWGDSVFNHYIIVDNGHRTQLPSRETCSTPFAKSGCGTNRERFG